MPWVLQYCIIVERNCLRPFLKVQGHKPCLRCILLNFLKWNKHSMSPKTMSFFRLMALISSICSILSFFFSSIISVASIAIFALTASIVSWNCANATALPSINCWSLGPWWSSTGIKSGAVLPFPRPIPSDRWTTASKITNMGNDGVPTQSCWPECSAAFSANLVLW